MQGPVLGVGAGRERGKGPGYSTAVFRGAEPESSFPPQPAAAPASQQSRSAEGTGGNAPIWGRASMGQGQTRVGVGVPEAVRSPQPHVPPVQHDPRRCLWLCAGDEDEEDAASPDLCPHAQDACALSRRRTVHTCTCIRVVWRLSTRVPMSAAFAICFS